MADFIKDPDAVLDYTVDWSDWLATGEEIASSSWVNPDGFTVNTSSNTTTVAVVWLSGGVAGRTYRMTNRITTDSTPARTDDRTITIKVAER